MYRVNQSFIPVTKTRGRSSYNRGDIIPELPEGVDWVKAGLVEEVETVEVSSLPKSTGPSTEEQAEIEEALDFYRKAKSKAKEDEAKAKGSSKK